MSRPACRVIINDRCLRNPETGVGRYVSRLLSGLERVAPDIQVFPFYSRLRPRSPGQDSGADRISAAQRAPDFIRRAAQGLYETAFEIFGAARSFNLYHEPNHIPVPWQGPILTTIHDLSLLRHPEWHPPDRVAWYEREFARGVSRTHHFITVSEFTRREMIELLHVEPERITVIPLGIDPEFFGSADAVGSAARTQSGATPVTDIPYLLFVGTLEPRKNVAGLLAAYAALPSTLRENTALVLAGMSGWGSSDAGRLAADLGITERVRVMGYVAEEDLRRLYRGALALVWPTFYEGFGLPPLEAMAAGTPVITSNVASLPEVVGDAAILVDPASTEQIAAAMRQIIEDDSLRQRLSTQGLARARQFSWDRCAAAHAELYRRFAQD